MKSKNIKVPLELLELIQNRTKDGPPGQVLLEIVKDYTVLEDYARSVNKQQASKASVSEIIMGYYHEQDTNIAEVEKSITELKTMLKGLEIYFTKVKK